MSPQEYRGRLQADLDPLEFVQGYADGWMAFHEGQEQGGKSDHNIPTDYSRSFVIGFQDAKQGKNRAWSEDEGRPRGDWMLVWMIAVEERA